MLLKGEKLGKQDHPDEYRTSDYLYCAGYTCSKGTRVGISKMEAIVEIIQIISLNRTNSKSSIYSRTPRFWYLRHG